VTVTFRGPERAADTPTLEAIYRLRAAVWRETGDVAQAAFADGRWSDEHDAASTHWVIRDGEELVAAARLSVHERLADVPEAEEYAAAGVRLDGRIAAPARVVVAAGFPHSETIDAPKTTKRSGRRPGVWRGGSAFIGSSLATAPRPDRTGERAEPAAPWPPLVLPAPTGHHNRGRSRTTALAGRDDRVPFGRWRTSPGRRPPRFAPTDRSPFGSSMERGETMSDQEAPSRPLKPIRRFDVFAEVSRLEALADGRPADEAKGHGVWLAKGVAGRRFGRKADKPDRPRVRQEGETAADDRPATKFKHAGDEL